jgi:Tol biopolymer transport system component
MTPEGGGRRVLSSGLDRDPVSWSPSGRWIAFVRQVGKNCYQLFAIRSNGQARHRLTRETCPAFFKPYWSREGKHVIYTLNVG